MILCCGEALIDMIPAQAEGGHNSFIPCTGGAIFNTAIALGRLGAKASLFTGISNDAFGRQITAQLQESNVNISHLVTFDAPCALAFLTMENGQASYMFYTQGAADSLLMPANCPPASADEKALFFGGISLCSEPSASTFHDLLKNRAADKVVMIDPNIRSSFIKDEKTYRARLMDMIAHSDILKVSDEDLAWFVPKQNDEGAQVQELLKGREKLVFVTRGSAGACAYFGANMIAQVRSPNVTVADTVGAGDTFNAGILHALEVRGLLTKAFCHAPDTASLTQVMNFATRAAAITVTRRGANPPWAEEL